MQFKQLGTKYVVRLDRGEQIVETLTQFCTDNKIHFGTISAIGAVSAITLGWYELATKSYHWKDFSGSLEVVSLTGNISILENAPFLHIHLVISDESYNAFGGHLKDAIAGGTLEVFIEKLDTQVNRQFHDETGLKLLDLKNSLS